MAQRVIFQDEDKLEFKGKIKELTVGHSLEGDCMWTRSLRDEFSEELPQFHLILTCNKLPPIYSDDPAICKRKNPSYYESEMEDVD